MVTGDHAGTPDNCWSGKWYRRDDEGVLRMEMELVAASSLAHAFLSNQ